MSNRYLKTFNRKSKSRENVYDSARNFYEINKFIDAVCSSHVDKVSEDLLDTICDSLLFNRNLTAKKVHEMLMSSLEKSIRYKDSLQEDDEKREVRA